MDQRDRILDATQHLTAAHGEVPSILAIAQAVGLTKQGVLHYFPSRGALDAAVLLRAVAKVDAAMADAAANSSPTATYLRLSSPDDGDRAALVIVTAGLREPASEPALEVSRAAARWEALITEELGDPVRAEVVRLVGDGLLGEALLTGTPPSPERIERLVTHLRAGSTPRRA